MNSGIGEQLCEGIERATTGERLDPSLTARARQRHRRRAITIRTAALTGTAAVAAVATFAATAGTGATQAGGTLPARTSAYIFSHTEAALAAAGQGTLIMRAAVKPPPIAGLAEVAVQGGTRHHPFFLRLSSLPIKDTISWLYRGRTRTQGFTPSGRLAIEVGPSAATRPTGPQAPPAVIAVNPATRTWYHPLTPVATYKIHDITCTNEGVDWLAVSVASERQLTALISKALSCHLFRADGQQVVDGILARRLAATPALMKQIHGEAGDVGKTMTLWVDSATYLPVRLTLSHAEQTDFGWLKPTPANLSLLQVKVPAGFRNVQVPPGAALVWAGMLPKK
jgi:hypothetical protein